MSTYSVLAPFYDSLMNHVNYDDWLQLIERIVRQHFPSRHISILEVGGGTGILGTLLKERGFTYVGSDLSFDMSKIAQKKGLPFFCADARHLPLKNRFDMMIFLYDGINYLSYLTDYKKIFSAAAEQLSKNGLFLFDVTTETNSQRYFYDYSYYEETDSSSLFRHSYFLPEKSLQCNDFTFFVKQDPTKDLYKKYTELHMQKLFKPAQIESVIPKKLFKVIGIWDGFSAHKYTRQSERIHFLLKRL